ncbi:LD-carboxypeptidase [Zooshikella harenae]|uniref:LD-carboxypeptidase n=1 Tax=Zooshikella harenae TaxID=2827238 RepID=A0ABS5ZFE2_9GAMM|nr:LD-carboxypeptidase [Zooshikella harenae]MBU2712766.1 LD-carboxypeptidase [Zooshikella harenae]
MIKKVTVAILYILFSHSLLAKNYTNVALISVSTQYNETKIPKIISTLEKENYVVTKKYLNQIVSDFGYVNTDQERAKNLINALINPKVDIIWFVRGGGGGINLLPYLYHAKKDLKKAKPKLIVGFSDVTAIHSFINEELGWKSIHGVVASYNRDMIRNDGEKIIINDQEPLPDIKNIAKNGVQYNSIIPLNKQAKKGLIGELRGGNLTLVTSLFSTRYEPNLNNKVLVIEDVGVSFRQLDRKLHQLLYKKSFNIKGILFGQFYPLDPKDEQRLIYKTVIENFAKKINKPVFYYPFIGHGRKNNPILLGSEVAIKCQNQSVYCTLKQQNIDKY